MTHPPRPHLQLSTHRVARSLLGGVLFWGLVHSEVLAQEARTVQVQAGDTASALALPLVPDGATLDQMLLALLRANPDAFIDDNINLLRAGQTLQLPATAQVLSTSAEQARETVLDHHTRFREYAQRLAAQARNLPEGAPRELSGKLSAPDSPRATAGTGQDKLTLTKELQDAQAMKLVLEKQTQEAMAHLAALQKNIESLQRLSQAGEASAPVQAPAQTTPVVPAWAWIAGLLTVALTVVLGLRRRDTLAARLADPVPVAVPAQMARISLDLDSPATDTSAGRQP